MWIVFTTLLKIYFEIGIRIKHIILINRNNYKEANKK